MSELRKMTRMGGDLRKIARLLQDKGRNGDTILAHINPREAALLREQGGAGTINPETGLQEFYNDDYGNPIPQTGYENVPEGLFEGAAYTPGYEAVPEGLFEGAAYTPGYEAVPQGLFEGAAYIPEIRGYESAPELVSGAYAGPVSQLDLTAQAPQETFARRGEAAGVTPTDFSLSGMRAPTVLGEPMAGPQAGPSRGPAEKGFLESLTGGDKTRLALGALGGLQTALTARKARQGAGQAAQQIRNIGAPYQQRGLAEQAAAARGELTPVNQQALEAQRARAAQAGVARGGVGIAQRQRAEEDLRQRLLAAQQDFGLKLSGIGDQYTARAIQEGIRADAEISNLFSNYYGNLTRLATPTLIQATQPAKG
jgi:hypothetical protein